MRHTRLSLTCDICEAEEEIEEPATRIVLLCDDGLVRALDLCDVHDGNTRPTQLQEAAKIYGTLLKAYVTRKGKLSVVPSAHALLRTHARSRQYHEPGGAWAGETSGPTTCLVPIDDGRPCAAMSKNVVGLKKHQFMRHGLKVKRS